MEARLQVARHGFGKPSCFDLHILQRDPLPAHLVLPVHCGMGHAYAVDIERKRRQIFIAYLQVVVMGRAVLVADQIHARAVDLDMVEHQLLPQQRQPRDVQPCIIDRREFARAVALAQQHLAGVQAQLGEKCDLDVALQHQPALGVVLHVLDDLRLEMVRIERQDEHDDDRRNDHQHDQNPGYCIAVILLGKRLGKRQLERTECRHQHADHAIQEGDMSKAKAARLHRKDRKIRKEERRMAAKDGGHITKVDQQKLNRQENGASKQIGK